MAFVEGVKGPYVAFLHSCPCGCTSRRYACKIFSAPFQTLCVLLQLEVHEAKAMMDNHPQWDIPDTEEEDEEQEDSDGIEESEEDDEDND